MNETFAFPKENMIEDPERIPQKKVLKKKKSKVSVDDGMSFGDVCEGWTPIAWIKELRRKALACEDSHPETAEFYRGWADKSEKTLPPESVLLASELFDRLVSSEADCSQNSRGNSVVGCEFHGRASIQRRADSALGVPLSIRVYARFRGVF